MSRIWTPRPNLANEPDDEKVAIMVKWFFENYEDPAERTPYETAEGGYQFIWGGPDDAREVLEEAFNDPGMTAEGTVQQGMKDELIEEAVKEIEENGGYEWVPRPHPSDYE